MGIKFFNMNDCRACVLPMLYKYPIFIKVHNINDRVLCDGDEWFSYFYLRIDPYIWITKQNKISKSSSLSQWCHIFKSIFTAHFDEMKHGTLLLILTTELLDLVGNIDIDISVRCVLFTSCYKNGGLNRGVTITASLQINILIESPSPLLKSLNRKIKFETLEGHSVLYGCQSWFLAEKQNKDIKFSRWREKCSE